MGNASLRKLAHIETISPEELGGANVGIDAPNWLYKYVTTTTQFTSNAAYRTEGKELPNLIGVPSGLRRFFKLNIKPVFVFDGTAHEMKHGEIEERKRKRLEAGEQAREADDKIEEAKFQAQAQFLTQTILETTQELFTILDIPYGTAPRAAEAQTAVMAQQGVVDYVISEDYDSMLFGAPRTVRKFTGSGELEVLDLEKTLSTHGITHEELVEIAILCGTDYNDGVDGIGPATAKKLVSEEQKTLERILEEYDAKIEESDRIRRYFLNPEYKELSAPKYPNPDVSNARQFIIGKWNIQPDEVSSYITEIEQEAEQPGLGSWT